MPLCLPLARLLPWPPLLMDAPSFLACLILLPLILNPVLGQGNLSSDVTALLAFKGNLTSSGAKLSSWNVLNASNVCSQAWEGVKCTGSGSSQRVTRLSLPGRSLIGPIAIGTLGMLDALETLSLRKNKLNGSLPADLANCAALKLLILYKNTFSGLLPSNFTVWPLLEELDVSFNNFSGPIPSSLGNLTNLTSLQLQYNSLSGTIPSIPSLTSLNVSNNQLNGSIPTTLSNFSSNAFAGNNLCGLPLAACLNQPITTITSQQNHRKLRSGAIVGIVFGSLAFLLLLLLLLLCFCLVCRKRARDKQRNKDLFAAGRPEFQQGQEAAVPATETKRGPLDPAAAVKDDKNRLVFVDISRDTFDLEDLLRASAEVLGKGSLGSTYKAVLDDGMIIAVKRLTTVVVDREEFVQRMEALGRLNHENLVPLRAYYFSKEEKLLVYDYMPGGSLSSMLHGTTGVGRTPLDWDTRLRIALSAARGIAYLHCNELVHGNVKSSNVLLTSSHDGCLADSGLIQLGTFGPGGKKTVGYTAPETTDSKKVTEKGDVYSFGILLLELLTGKAATKAAMSGDGVDLPRWAQSVEREGLTKDVFDAELTKYQNVEGDMVQLFHIALPCVSPSPDLRPTMADVVKMIETLRKTDDASAESQFERYPGSSSEIDESH